MITRRQLLAVAGAAPACLASTAAAAPAGLRMGGTPTAFSIRSRAAQGGKPFDIIEHCHSIGLAGTEISGQVPTDAEGVKQLRAKLEKYSMHLVCNPRLPQPGGDTAAFDAQVQAFKEAGALALHAAMTQRRYEEFAAFEPFKASFERNKEVIRLAEPILRRHRIRLAIENHKGWRAAEQAEWLKRLGSEWVGVCLDFGNNLSLCETPMDTLRTLLPMTFYAHIKDMAVEEYEDGFLLSEVPMGEGILDLKQMVEMMRAKDPNMLFNLEMITRDPLKIPVYTDKYWVTFDDSYSPLPGRDIAKVLSLVRTHKPKKPLPRITGLSPEAQLKLEDDGNAQCIAYARQNLGL
jgi:3-oxoisoapionate decarboxylase